MSGEQTSLEATRLGALLVQADEASRGPASGPSSLVVAPDWKVEGQQRLLRSFAEEKRRALPAQRPVRPVASGARLSDAAGINRRLPAARILMVAALFTCAICGVLLWEGSAKLLGGDALTFVLRGATGEERNGGRISAAERPETLEFSDGSVVSVEPGGVLRVRETEERGATVVVERGTVQSSIVHRAETRWSLFAGPFEVKVVGTQFSTAWDPESGSFAVVLDEGEVKILGAGIEEEVTLRAGQGFFAHQSGQWHVAPLEGATHPNGSGTKGAGAMGFAGDAQHPPSQDVAKEKDLGQTAQLGISGGRISHESAPGAATVEERRGPDAHKNVDGLVSSGRASGAPHTSEMSSPQSWGQLVAEGKFEAVLEAAQQRGTEACLRSCTAGQLRALGDAARYSGRTGLARDALLRLRDVAPHEGARAAYLLGSLAEARGQVAGALGWYRKYVAEAGSGALAAEAHAGVLRCLLALGHKEEAKRAAQRYLKLYPRGVGAQVARQILRNP